MKHVKTAALIAGSVMVLGSAAPAFAAESPAGSAQKQLPTSATNPFDSSAGGTPTGQTPGMGSGWQWSPLDLPSSHPTSGPMRITGQPKSGAMDGWSSQPNSRPVKDRDATKADDQNAREDQNAQEDQRTQEDQSTQEDRNAREDQRDQNAREDQNTQEDQRDQNAREDQNAQEEQNGQEERSTQEKRSAQEDQNGRSDLKSRKGAAKPKSQQPAAAPSAAASPLGAVGQLIKGLPLIGGLLG